MSGPANARSGSGRSRRRSVTSGSAVAHLNDYEGPPARRPLTYAELQGLFDFLDFLDDRVERIARSGRKGALEALRDPRCSRRRTRSGCAATSCPGLKSPYLRPRRIMLHSAARRPRDYRRSGPTPSRQAILGSASQVSSDRVGRPEGERHDGHLRVDTQRRRNDGAVCDV